MDTLSVVGLCWLVVTVRALVGSLIDEISVPNLSPFSSLPFSEIKNRDEEKLLF